MDISLEFALQIFDKWKSEAIVIGVITSVANLNLRLRATVDSCDNATLILRCGEESAVIVDLENCVFQYCDPREMPGVPVPDGGHTYVAFVVIQSAGNDVITLFEPVEGL
jgi:hypothetical protein